MRTKGRKEGRIPQTHSLFKAKLRLCLWAWVTLPDNELLSPRLTHTCTDTQHTEAFSLKLLLLLLHNIWLLLFHYAAFFLLRSPSSPPWFLVLIFLAACLCLTDCRLYLSCTVWLHMITKANFSCEIPLTLWLRVVAASWWKCRRTGTGECHTYSLNPRNFLSYFPRSVFYAIPSLHAALISPLALSKQVGHVWHSPLTCSQA